MGLMMATKPKPVVFIIIIIKLPDQAIASMPSDPRETGRL
jgi:hypothetical protein